MVTMCWTDGPGPAQGPPHGCPTGRRRGRKRRWRQRASPNRGAGDFGSGEECPPFLSVVASVVVGASSA